jgi:serine/threonine-protein kinase
MVRGDELSPGGRLGEFEIVRRLGRGPNGVVYAARHVATGQAVAIKCFSGQGTAVAGRWREAFGRWGPGIASLSERSIGTVHRFDSVGTVFYRVSDLYLGPDGGPLNLDGYRRQVGGTSGWFDQGVVRKFGMLLLGALEYAHGQGLAHGNLKPGNVLFHYLGEEGGCWRVHLILTDFALTAVLGAVPNPKANPWLSPEQREGRPADVASDVYAAGLFLLYCLTGQHRFPDSDRLGDLRPDLHDAWQPIIRKATRPEPERRFVSAEEMAQFVATVSAE